jgi:hypothetical protein
VLQKKKDVSVGSSPVDYSLKLSLVGKALLIEGDVLVEVEESECMNAKTKLALLAESTCKGKEKTRAGISSKDSTTAPKD